MEYLSFQFKNIIYWEEMKNWVMNLTFQLSVQIFKMYLLNFGPKMPENEDFCLSFELFPQVSDFLSFGVLEFFSGVHKKSMI